MYLILAVLAIALFADLRFPNSSEKSTVTTTPVPTIEREPTHVKVASFHALAEGNAEVLGWWRC